MPALILAPMAGVSDLAYRTICARLGATVTVSEMVSSRGLVYHDKKTAQLLSPTPTGTYGVQIFGNDPDCMAQAAQEVLKLVPASFLDINMGCPTPKIVNNGDGCALMKDLNLAEAILRAVVQAASVPVTVKIRLGWDRGSINAPELARRAQACGVQAVAVHGRTKQMGYSGRADYDAIREVVQAVQIPVIANGDVACASDVPKCLNRTGAAGVMIGRAAFGNPYIFQQAAAVLNGWPEPELPPLHERIGTALEQFHIAMEDKGEHVACLEARKYFAWYLKGVKWSAYYKEQISHLSSAQEVERVAAGIIRELR